MNATIEEVIEAHRQAVGATSVRVSLGPEATPVGLAAELERLRAEAEGYRSFRPEERAAAENHRLRTLLHQIDLLARSGDTAEIVSLVDMVPDVVLPADTEWMAGERRRRGEALPEHYEATLPSCR